MAEQPIGSTTADFDPFRPTPGNIRCAAGKRSLAKQMLSHVYFGITDFPRAFAFYAALMEELGLKLRFQKPAEAWAGWMRDGAERPLFLIGRPYDGASAEPGNGNMVALLAPDRACVDRCHALALSSGGRDEGAPGLRPWYHPNYYGAYFRDPDGNKLCVCCHQPEPQDH